MYLPRIRTDNRRITTAKDVWMFGIGLTLLIERARRRVMTAGHGPPAVALAMMPIDVDRRNGNPV
jgi:hypothetical protein